MYYETQSKETEDLGVENTLKSTFGCLECQLKNVSSRGCKCNEDSENGMELCHRVSEVSQRNGVEATGITLAHMQGLGISSALSII